MNVSTALNRQKWNGTISMLKPSVTRRRSNFFHLFAIFWQIYNVSFCKFLIYPFLQISHQTIPCSTQQKRKAWWSSAPAYSDIFEMPTNHILQYQVHVNVLKWFFLPLGVREHFEEKSWFQVVEVPRPASYPRKVPWRDPFTVTDNFWYFSHHLLWRKKKFCFSTATNSAWPSWPLEFTDISNIYNTLMSTWKESGCKL